jgi:hypothetical protein
LSAGQRSAERGSARRIMKGSASVGNLFKTNASLRHQLDEAQRSAAQSEAAAKAAEAAAKQAVAALQELTRDHPPTPQRKPDSKASPWAAVTSARVIGEGEAAVRLDAHGKPCLDSIPGILARLDSNSEAVRAEGTLLLAMLLENVTGQQARLLGEFLREACALELLVEQLDEHDMLTVQRTLMILGNLCSDSVDANSALTKQALLGTAALNRIVMHMEDPVPATRLYAVAALQNIVVDEALALAAIEEGAVRAIERVVKGMQPPSRPPNAEDAGSDESECIYYFASGAPHRPARRSRRASLARLGLPSRSRAARRCAAQHERRDGRGDGAQGGGEGEQRAQVDLRQRPQPHDEGRLPQGERQQPGRAGRLAQAALDRRARDHARRLGLSP